MYNKKDIIEMLIKLESQDVELNLSQQGFEWYYKLKQEVIAEETKQLVG